MYRIFSKNPASFPEVSCCGPGVFSSAEVFASAESSVSVAVSVFAISVSSESNVCPEVTEVSGDSEVSEDSEASEGSEVLDVSCASSVISLFGAVCVSSPGAEFFFSAEESYTVKKRTFASSFPGTG